MNVLGRHPIMISIAFLVSGLVVFVLGCSDATLMGGNFNQNNFVPSSLLGQPNSAGISPALGSAGMDAPRGMATDGQHFVVTDQLNNRVLIWNSIPTTVDQPADLVLGQPDFITAASGCSSTTMSGPTGVAIYQGKLLVADYNNNRVLIWTAFPASINASPNFVIGQANMTTCTLGTTGTTLHAPVGIAINNNGGLYIADSANNRVLYFSSIPSSNGTSATYALGQTALTNASVATSQGGLNGPYGVSANYGYVAVADTSNNRVVMYSDPPVANGPNAFVVLGQASYISNPTGCGPGMSGPQAVFMKGNGNLYVGDGANHRVLMWYTAGSDFNGQIADNVFGQPNTGSCVANGTYPNTVSSPNGVYSDNNNYLWVSDFGWNRVITQSWY